MSQELAVAEREKPSLVDIEASIVLVKNTTTLATPEHYLRMGDAWTALRAKADALREWYKPRKKKAKDAWDQWCDDERDALAAVSSAIEHAGSLMSAYTAEQERVARLEAVQEAAKRAAAEEARVLEEAAALDEAGAVMNDPEMQFHAQEMLARVNDAPRSVPVTPRPAAPKVAGLNMSPSYEPVVTSKARIIEHLAAHPELHDLLDVNVSVSKKYATLYKERLSAVIPGLTAVRSHKPSKARGKKP